MEIKTFDIICKYMDEEFEDTIDSNLCSESDVLEDLKGRKKERYEEESGEDMNSEPSEEFEVSDWGDTPEWCQDWDILEELMPEWDKSYLSIEVFEAAHDCNIPFSDVDEAYNGEFNSDEDFAESLAEETGSIDKDAKWPMNCIDWEQAAKELMWDYCSSNNFYFRNL